MELIHTYFPNLTATQVKQFEQMYDQYAHWNSQINVISRKDIENLYQNHILHSLAIAKFIKFKSGSSIADLGTGGGFPGVPLAVMFPEVQFHLIDSIGKKLLVVNEVCKAIGVANVTTHHARLEELKKVEFDFVVTRAVATLDKLIIWTRTKIAKKEQNPIPNGIIALKGMNLIKEEIKAAGKGIYTEINPLSEFYKEPFFEEKCLLYVQA